MYAGTMKYIFPRHVMFILLQFDRLPNPQSILTYIKNLALGVRLERTTGFLLRINSALPPTNRAAQELNYFKFNIFSKFWLQPLAPPQARHALTVRRLH